MPPFSGTKRKSDGEANVEPDPKQLRLWIFSPPPTASRVNDQAPENTESLSANHGVGVEPATKNTVPNAPAANMYGYQLPYGTGIQNYSREANKGQAAIHATATAETDKTNRLEASH